MYSHRIDVGVKTHVIDVGSVMDGLFELYQLATDNSDKCKASRCAIGFRNSNVSGSFGKPAVILLGRGIDKLYHRC
jgi:hypothetical protein